MFRPENFAISIRSAKQASYRAFLDFRRAIRRLPPRPVRDVVIVTNRFEAGLDVDRQILVRSLEFLECRVAVAEALDRSLPDFLRGLLRADLVIHLENVAYRWLTAAPRNILIPNQEWLRPGSRPFLGHIDLVACKTAYAAALFRDLGCPVFDLGFTGLDIADPGDRVPEFLHVCGKSRAKGTGTVLCAWGRHPEWPRLTVVGRPPALSAEDAATPQPNVRILSSFVAAEELRRLQNRCLFHLCPSETEGFGHSLVEALAAGAIPITTDAPPMNELVTSDCGLLIAPDPPRPSPFLGAEFPVSVAALETAVDRALSLSPTERLLLARNARARYEDIGKSFAERLPELIETIGRV